MKSGGRIYDEIHLERKRLHEQIADNIQDMVRTQELRPGDRLPPERELAQTLHVSRPTVREAMRLLQHRGLVTMKAGSGTYVSRMGAGVVAESIERFSALRECTFDDMMQVRELLEPGAAALAALRATPEEIEMLRRKAAAIDEAFESGNREKLALAEAEFHAAVANASANDLLAAITGGISHVVRKWLETSMVHGLRRDSIRIHHEIVEAIAARDPERARGAGARHLELSRRLYAESQKT